MSNFGLCFARQILLYSFPCSEHFANFSLVKTGFIFPNKLYTTDEDVAMRECRQPGSTGVEVEKWSSVKCYRWWMAGTERERQPLQTFTVPSIGMN